MLRESDEWGEKENRKRIRTTFHAKESGNPFYDLRLEYSVDMDDEEQATQLLQKVIEGDPEDLRQTAEAFLSRLEEAKTATVTRFSLGKSDQILLSHICEKAGAEVSALWGQFCELASGDISDEEFQKASLFFYISLGTTAETVCSLVCDEMVLN